MTRRLLSMCPHARLPPDQGMLSPQAAGEREGQKRRAESPIPEDGERSMRLHGGLILGVRWQSSVP